MSMDSSSSTLYRTSQGVLAELETDFPHLVLSRDIKLGKLIGTGGYAEVYEGTLKVVNSRNKTKVAVKRFRFISTREEEFTKTFKRELGIWARLEHENVLTLIGLVYVEGMPALASEWMENGTMNEYLNEHTDANICEVVRDIANGMRYLHEQGVVHSDLKGDNVLISRDGRAVLSDFGVSRLLINSVTVDGTASLKGAARWMAPELMTPVDIPQKHEYHTKATDVWAFGMVVYEALSGDIPFKDSRNDAQVMMSIVSGTLPAKPEERRAQGEVFERLWRCCLDCWVRDPAKRPRMMEVAIRLNYPQSRLTVEATLKISGRGWVSPTSRIFLATKSADGLIVSFSDARSGNQCGPDLRLGSDVFDVAWSSTTEHMFTLTEDRILRKWGNTLGSAAIANAKHDCAQWLEFSPDDKFIMSCGGYASKLWRASDLSLVREFLGDWYSVAFHPMGHRLLLLGPRSIIDMNIEDLEIITATEHKLYFDVFDVVFDPSGNIFAATTDQGVVKIIAANMTEEKASLPYNDVRRMRFTPDGKYLLLVRGSKTVVLWDVAAGCTIDELILYLDLESVYLAEISKCCRVLSFDDGMGSAYTIHLGSTCY